MVEIKINELYCIKDNNPIGFVKGNYYSITAIINEAEDYYLYYTYGFNFDKDFVKEHFVSIQERRALIIKNLLE